MVGDEFGACEITEQFGFVLNRLSEDQSFFRQFRDRGFGELSSFKARSFESRGA